MIHEDCSIVYRNVLQLVLFSLFVTVSNFCHDRCVMIFRSVIYFWYISESVLEPFLVEVRTSDGIVQFQNIACGKSHTMAVSSNGELWGWGMSEMVGGKSALTKNGPLQKPELVEHLCGRRVLQV